MHTKDCKRERQLHVGRMESLAWALNTSAQYLPMPQLIYASIFSPPPLISLHDVRTSAQQLTYMMFTPQPSSLLTWCSHLSPAAYLHDVHTLPNSLLTWCSHLSPAACSPRKPVVIMALSRPADWAAVRKAMTARGDIPWSMRLMAIGRAPQEHSGTCADSIGYADAGGGV